MDVTEEAALDVIDRDEDQVLPIPSTMFLQKIEIKGFRSCFQIKVDLQPALTLLVGENNAGKSNIIEALRLATHPLSGRRTRYFNEEDVNRHWPEESVGLSMDFAGASNFQQAQFISGLDLSSRAIRLSTRFYPANDVYPYGRSERLVGMANAPDPEPEKRDQINHVYLAPLRDAQRELDSGSGTRLATILRYLVVENERRDFVEQAQLDLRNLASHGAIRAVNQGLQDHVTRLTDSQRPQDIGLTFDPPDLHRLARGLRLKMAEHGIDLADLASSGLGYANLLFMSTVILELQNARSSELTLFLVEEPEAHLHPQLQAVLLEFLMEQAESSGSDDSQGPAGRIQVIATTHSPNLASSVGISNVVVVRSARIEANDAEVDSTVALALAQIPLEESDRRKIDQYLDVTRAELLFTTRAVLVEGISEAVLLPSLVRNCVLQGSDAANAQKRRAFRATSVISLGSVDFKPYLSLLLSKIGGQRLLDRLLVVTDGDPEVSGPEPEAALGESKDTSAALTEESEEITSETKEAYNRKSDLLAHAEALAAAEIVYVAEAPYTLEADLFIKDSNNGEVLKQAYLLQRPRSREKWDRITSTSNPPESIYAHMKNDKKFIAKGQFAHDVALAIAQGAEFTCPEYLEDGVRWLLEQN